MDIKIRGEIIEWARASRMNHLISRVINKSDCINRETFFTYFILDFVTTTKPPQMLRTIQASHNSSTSLALPIYNFVTNFS